MEQEDKQLLLKDLCARSPYGVMADYVGECIKVKYVNPHLGMIYISYFGITKWEAVEVIKPYLRSMSSMTEEEKKEAKENGCIIYHDTSPKNRGLMVIASPKGIDWLNAHHFDYRNLIEQGLAIEAPEGMYKF